MVNGVNGNKYYEYTKVKNTTVADTGEKFSLDYKQEDLSKEAREKQDKTISEQEKQQEIKQSGVKLEISGSGQAASADLRKQSAGKSGTAAKEPSVLEIIQSAFSAVISAVKDFFYKIWYDPEPVTKNEKEAGFEEVLESEEELISENAAQVTGIEEISERQKVQAAIETDRPTEDNKELENMDAAAVYRMNEERLNREIQPYLRKGDLNQVLNLLTDNGRKAAARNSSLLTYYDRNGRMIEPNASDRERILHGDRNTRKL